MVKLICFLFSLFYFQSVMAADKIITIEEKTMTGQKLIYDGFLVPGKVVEIVSPIQAMVTQTYFEFGDVVKQNQLLFELDPKETEILLATAKTELLEQNYQIEKLKNWDSSSEVVKAKYNLNRELKHYEYAKEHFKQSEKLYSAGIISREEYLLDQRHNEDSFHNYQNAKELLEEILKKGDPNYLSLAQMKLKQIEERVKLIESKLIHSKISSPITGIILSPQSDKNTTLISHRQKIYPPGQVMALIADMHSPAVEFKVDELDVVKIKKKQGVVVQFYAYPQYEIKGEVHEIALHAASKEGASNTRFNVKVKLRDIPAAVEDKLFLGFTAKVSLDPDTLKGLIIPKAAVLFEGNQQYVQLLSGKQLIKKPIEVNIANEDHVLIAKGLNVGDKIAIPG